MPQGTTGTVLGGPTVANGYTWWRIQTSLGTGWAAGEFLSLDTDPPPPAPGIAVGDTVVVDTDALNLRSTASTNGTIIAVMPNGTTLTVVGGPTTASGYTWWRVQNATYGPGWCVEDYLAEV